MKVVLQQPLSKVTTAIGQLKKVTYYSTPEGYLNGGSARGLIGPEPHRGKQVAEHLIMHVGL